MSQTRIYQPGTYESGQTVYLDELPSHHLSVVLRKKVGDLFILFPGNHIQYQAKITAIKKTRVEIFVGEAKITSCESPLSIHLAQSISKGEKMDWIIQKATELGIHQFTPIISAYSAPGLSDPPRLEKKMKHWHAIMIHATEQCGRTHLPQLNQPEPFERFIESGPNLQQKHSRWILCPHAKTSLKNQLRPENEVLVLVGPEGGWSSVEGLNANNCGFQSVTLGPRILRTETAPLAVISILQFMSGDF